MQSNLKNAYSNLKINLIQVYVLELEARVFSPEYYYTSVIIIITMALITFRQNIGIYRYHISRLGALRRF